MNSTGGGEASALAGGADVSVVAWLDRCLHDAIRRGASDLHVEPFERALQVRIRIDGVLEAVMAPDPSWAESIGSRIKVLANLDIAERRRPQDGRIGYAFEDRIVDLRVSTLPTAFGESVVVRILDRSKVTRSLDDLGQPAPVAAAFKAALQKPHGLIVVTGPTGSGKTTTLYSALRSLDSGELKVVTAEDPVEFELDGWVQVSVSPGIGLTFPAVLRSFLRQDPDVIMIGEVRDGDTAQMAVQAALTGHLVLSTLHTHDAASAVARMVDLGVEPFLLAAALEGVLAQRLVRRLCAVCRGGGCPACDERGFRGRLGLYEWLPITSDLRDLVLAGAPAEALCATGLASGMVTLREAGNRAILAGLTTAAEVSLQV